MHERDAECWADAVDEAAIVGADGIVTLPGPVVLATQARLEGRLGKVVVVAGAVGLFVGLVFGLTLSEIVHLDGRDHAQPPAISQPAAPGLHRPHQGPDGVKAVL